MRSYAFAKYAQEIRNSTCCAFFIALLNMFILYNIAHFLTEVDLLTVPWVPSSLVIVTVEFKALSLRVVVLEVSAILFPLLSSIPISYVTGIC